MLMAVASPVAMVQIPAGDFTPQFSPEPGTKQFKVSAFWMDAKPVSQGEFLAFVTQNAQWRRSVVPAIFQEGSYLAHWAGDLVLPSPSPQLPEPSSQAVTRVSWMAARAYCGSVGKRLPTLLEWEYAAEEPDPTKLLWYSQVGVGIPVAVGLGIPNRKGIYDLHQMYEWVEDFNQVMMVNDSRQGVEKDNLVVCGNSGNANDRMNYAAFTRYAFWSSLRPSYTMKNLGFRCVRDP